MSAVWKSSRWRPCSVGRYVAEEGGAARRSLLAEDTGAREERTALDHVEVKTVRMAGRRNMAAFLEGWFSMDVVEVGDIRTGVQGVVEEGSRHSQGWRDFRV